MNDDLTVVAAPGSTLTPRPHTREQNRLLSTAFWAAQPRFAVTDGRNGDEGAHPDGRGNFTKGLAHDKTTGLATGYAALATALDGASPAGIDGIALSSANARKWVSPKSAYATELMGGDPDQYRLPPAPSFSSASEVVEIVENYWMARLRDTAFNDYASDALAAEAVADITAVINAAVALGETPAVPVPTVQTLFRGNAEGEGVGPHLSQFMLLPSRFGAERIDRRMRTVVAHCDYVETWDEWLSVQNGDKKPGPKLDPDPRYMRNGRDLSEWVHVDKLYQAYFMACLNLIAYTRDAAGNDPAVASNLPYQAMASSTNQDGFATFGPPHVLALVTEVSTRALKAVWRQKWRVNRRLRPEVFAGRIHAELVRGQSFLTTKQHDVLKAATHLCAWAENERDGGANWLLPLAFPEGSPMHPSYGAGHATVAGACTTILKAWFDGSKPLVELHDPFTGSTLKPVVPDAAGFNLVNTGVPDAAALTIEGELNKIAANISIGRNIAGVHWRTDHTASIALGERVAMHTLWDYACSFGESGVTFKLRSFKGDDVTITATGIAAGGNPHSAYETGDITQP